MSKEDISPPPSLLARELTEETLIPLLEEQLTVSKRVVETGVIRLHKHTEERTETIEVPLQQVAWEIERVPVNQVIAEQPVMRVEGETTVYPVIEERVTVVRQLVLLEEVRVTRRVATRNEVSSHVLRREQIVEERVAIAPTSERST